MFTETFSTSLENVPSVFSMSDMQVKDIVRRGRGRPRIHPVKVRVQEGRGRPRNKSVLEELQALPVTQIMKFFSEFKKIKNNSEKEVNGNMNDFIEASARRALEIIKSV